MKKRILIVLISIVILLPLFAESYVIKIQHSDLMNVGEKIVELSGKVNLSFETNGENNKISRVLQADKIVVDTEKKNLEATGNVVFTEGKKDSFKGDVLSLNWDTLDAVMEEGSSSSVRTGASGNKVTFYATGKNVSYSGSENTVFFRNGRISTTEKDPYWSIKAKNIALAGSDFFVENATFRLGRVPFLYLPVFFYPSTTMVINPSVGFESSKGMFLNTTYEVFGTYPYFSAGKGASSDAGSLLSLFETEDSSKKIKDGIIYRPMGDKEQLTGLEKWASETKSYLAIFADLYEKYGFSIGFDTVDNSKDKSFVFKSSGLVAYSKTIPSDAYGKQLRYALDINLNLKKKKTTLSVTLPFLSDPNVKSAYLNRNSIFSFDSLFGKEQFFPSKYSSGVTEQTASFNLSTSFKLWNLNFNVSSLSAKRVFKWDGNSKKYVVTNTLLPSYTITSNGTLIDVKGKSKTQTENLDYSSEMAKEFAARYEELNKNSVAKNSVGNFEFIKPDTINLTKTKTKQGSSFKLSYSLKNLLNNTYEKASENKNLETTLNGSLTANLTLPNKIISITEVISPTLNYKKDNLYSHENTLFDSSLSASIPVAGLSYNLNTRLYSSEKNNTVKKENKFLWNKEYVKSHSISLSKSVSKFTFSVKETLPPLDEYITPAVSFSNNGYSASANIDFDIKNGIFKKGFANLNFSVSKKKIVFNFKSNYDFSKNSWDGFTANADAKIVLKENMQISGKTKFEALNHLSTQLRFDYKSNYAVMNFSGNDFSLMNVGLYFNYNMSPYYFWKNRIGIESKLNSSFVFDVDNPYASSISFDFSMKFAISEFIDVAFSVNSLNNSFFRYYSGNKFIFKSFTTDLLNSINLFNAEKRNSTGFNISSLSLSLVHKMADWNLYIDAKASVEKNTRNKFEMVPQVSVSVKWNALPEIKLDNSWKETNGWEKK